LAVSRCFIVFIIVVLEPLCFNSYCFARAVVQVRQSMPRLSMLSVQIYWSLQLL